MKKLVLTLGLVMLVAAPAMAAPTVYSDWNGAPAPAGAPGTWKDVDFNFMDRLAPPVVPINDYLLHNSAWWTLPVLGPGKFGTGMDATQDPGNLNKATGGYFIANYELEGQTMLDAAGTIQFWFKPNWDSAQDTEVRHIVSGQQYYPAAYGDHAVALIQDGANSRLQYTNMDNTLTTTIPYNPTSITADFNHIAICWDASGTSLYMNGVLLGSDPEKLAMAEAPLVENQYFFIGGRQAPPASVDMYGADGTFDDFAVDTQCLYSGPDYTVPGELGIPEPTTLALLGLGGVLLRRRRR